MARLTREKLLEAAKAEFFEKGWSATGPGDPREGWSVSRELGALLPGREGAGRSSDLLGAACRRLGRDPRRARGNDRYGCPARLS